MSDTPVEMTPNDLRELIRRHQRDRAALGEFFCGILDRFLENSRRLSADDREDVRQETLLVIFQDLDKIQDRDDPSTWVFGIAVKKIADVFRRKKRQIDIIALDEAFRTQSSSARDSELFAKYREARDSLSDAERLVFDLITCGWTNDDMKFVFQGSIHTVKQIRASMQKKLDEMF